MLGILSLRHAGQGKDQDLQGEYFIGGIQHRDTPVVVAVQHVSLLVYGVDDAETPQ